MYVNGQGMSTWMTVQQPVTSVGMHAYEMSIVPMPSGEDVQPYICGALAAIDGIMQ